MNNNFIRLLLVLFFITTIIVIIEPRAFAQAHPSHLPPIGSLISLSAPDDNHMTTVTGLAGATASNARVFVMNFDSGSVAVVDSDDQGAFSAEVFAPYGSQIIVRQDAQKLHLNDEFLNSGFFTHDQVVLGATQLFRQRDENPLTFDGTRVVELEPENPFPAWQLSGAVNSNALEPGDAFRVTGTLTILSTLQENKPEPVVGCIQLERHTQQDGTQIIPRARFVSTFLTATGFPIERHMNRTESFEPCFDVAFGKVSNNTWQAEIDWKFTIPESTLPGYYLPHASICCFSNLKPEPPPTEFHFAQPGSGHFQLPLLKVGNAMPPRMFLHLLTDSFHNGSRGVNAIENRGEFNLTSIAAQSDVFIIPMVEPFTGEPISYSLEPFVPQATLGERSTPTRRMAIFDLPSGEMSVTVEKPNGKKKFLGPAQISHVGMSTSEKNANGELLNIDGQHMTDALQLKTAGKAFNFVFDEYGLHIIRVDAAVDDIWGNTWTGSGTFEVWVANPLVIDTAVLPGAVFQEGDTLNTGVVVSPAGPASVTLTYTIAPDSDESRLEHQYVLGRANRFGHFQSHIPGFELDQAGEYRVDVTARYTDDQGGLWMGSRTWGGVVARKNPPIVAHGRRGADFLSEIGPQWFTATEIGIEGGNQHVHFPFANGDIQWLDEADAAVPVTSFQDLDGQLADLFRGRLHDELVIQPPGTLEDRILAGEIPLMSGRPEPVDAHLDPESIDLWAYSYRVSERPLVRVREMIGEDRILPYWRFDEQYARQVGVGVLGDLPNEIKFQYGGVVIRGAALPRPEYAIHGSLFVLVPAGEDGIVSRTFPPFQGNGGGPSGGPIITFKGEDIDLLINLRAVRPGSVMEVGDTFSLAGAIGPTLDARVSYTLTKPSGAKLNFSGRANPVGYYYDPQDDFILDQPGIYVVDLKVIFDRRTSAGQVTEPFPSGNVLGSDAGRFYFYVVDANSQPMNLDLASESLIEPADGDLYTLDVKAVLPQGYAITAAHVTTMMPGTILESRQLSTSLPLTYHLNINELGEEVPNLDLSPELADLLTISIYAQAQDQEGATHHLGRVINLHGDQVYAVESSAQGSQINVSHAGAWFNPDTAGQGQFIDVDSEKQFMFVSWFTYTDAASAHPFEQRWLTAQGNYSGSTAELDLFESLGGQFDDPQAVTTTRIGEVTLFFNDCGNGQMAYSLDEEGLQGIFPLLRVIPGSGNVCEERGGNTTQVVDINAGMDGAWFDDNTPGQGFFIDAHSDMEGGNFIFVSWFTYGEETASGQRWLTAQGSFEGSIAELDVFETTGGSFDDPQAPGTNKVGTMNIDFADCADAQLTYSLTDDGAEGDITITRVIPGGQALCEELTGTD